MDYFPILLELQDASVLIVGGGKVATRKADMLVRAGARLTVVAPEISERLAQLLEQHGGTWLSAKYPVETISDEEGGLAHLFSHPILVIAATHDRAINARVSLDAKTQGIPVNVIDSPELSTFLVPSIVDRTPVIVAISSSGHSPVISRLLRQKIEALIPSRYGKLAQFAGRMRDTVRAAISSDAVRRRFWENTLEGSVSELALAGREADAEDELHNRLHSDTPRAGGEVFLIGAGPGDPDLMTFKAVRLLQSADVVLYDRLVSAPILDLSRRDAERIYVGKTRSDHTLPQTEINQLLVDLALTGKRVARLKGGDPFIFGRGGEEIELLAENQIQFQVVPGVTAATGAACYAGIPLTHRDHAQSVRFITGHLKNNVDDYDWTQFQNPAETLVFYMGLAGLAEICRKLQNCGRSCDTPIALIEKGTLPQQRVLTGTLDTMVGIVEKQKPTAPTLIIVGTVVSLQASLAWFGGERS